MKKSKVFSGQGPVPKGSRLSPSPSRIPKKVPSVSVARSAEDIPRRVQLSCSTELTPLRSMSPGSNHGSKLGVRYITEDLIKRTTKQENLALITTLNLTLSNDIGKKIKYIENLESLKQLQVLNLSGNCIEKIERLEKLTQLQELNLSFNNIRKVEGMEGLVNLQVLNLTGNQIEHIPPWLGKKLKSLRVFKIAKNNLVSLSELSRLKILPDLVQLSLADNPLSELPHSTAYVIFHIRTLEILNGQPITSTERNKAKERFSMEEIVNLEKALDNQETKNQKLEEEKNKFVKEQKQIENDFQILKKKDQETSNRIKELEQELKTKNDLLKKKTKELHRACEKHYQLEQELAFYKIDAKFANLGEEPVADQTLDTDDNEPLIESPYIGKALFKPNQFAKEVQNATKAQKAKLISMPQNDEITNSQNIILQQKKKQTEMEEILQEKQQEIESAKISLKKLQETLFQTESQVTHAYEEFQRVSNLIPRSSPANEMKMIMRQTLADKMKNVNVLRNQAGVLEKEINKAENSVAENREEMSKLKWQLQQLNSTDSTYKEIYSEMVEKEQQIYEDNEVSHRLEEQLEDILETIATETHDIRDLEQQLQQDVEHSSPEAEELRQELGGVVTGLQTYLESVKNKNHKQMKHIEQLLSEREKLQDKVNDLTSLLENVNQDDQILQKLKKHVAKTEAALLEHQEFSVQLEKELEMKEREEKDLEEQLNDAGLHIKDLKEELEETERRAQAEIQSLEQQLIAEKENTLFSTKKAFVEIEKDQCLSQISEELKKSKLMNIALKNEIEVKQKKFDQCINDYILPGDLKKRMKNLSHSLKTGKSFIQPENNKDFVGQIFQDLQKGLQDRLNRMKKEIDTNRQNEKKLIQQNQALTNKLDEAVNKIEQMKKNKNQEIVETRLTNDKENKLLQEEIKELKKSLEETKEKLKIEKKKAFENRVVYARSESSSEHDTMNSEERHLFDELQSELVDFKTKMKDKEDLLNQQLADADAKVSFWQSKSKKQQQFYQQELQKQKAENQTQQTEQGICTKLIAGELENARAMLNNLQGLLDQRQQQLMMESQQANMSDQMIASQEEELSHLYKILEAQREEIENLNNALNQLMHQNPKIMGPAYEDQLKYLQDKVGHLTKEIATQSSVVQGFPVSMGTNVSPVNVEEKAPSSSGILGMHHGPVISAEPLHISTSNNQDYPLNVQQTQNEIYNPKPGEIHKTLNKMNRNLTQSLNLTTGEQSIPMNRSSRPDSAIKISPLHSVPMINYTSFPTTQHFNQESIQDLTSSQTNLISSAINNDILDEARRSANRIAQPNSTLIPPEYSSMPTHSVSSSHVQGFSNTTNNVATEPIHRPLNYHTGKVLEITPTSIGGILSTSDQLVSNPTMNPVTQKKTLLLTNDSTMGPASLISNLSPAQIQPTEHISSFVRGKQISHSGNSFGQSIPGLQLVDRTDPGISQFQARDSLTDKNHAASLGHQHEVRTESNQIGTEYSNPLSSAFNTNPPQPGMSRLVMTNPPQPIQVDSTVRPFLGQQNPSLSQEYQPTASSPIKGQMSRRFMTQGHVMSPSRKTVAFQKPLVNDVPSSYLDQTNPIKTAPQSILVPDSSTNFISTPNNSQTYSSQVLRNMHSFGYDPMTPTSTGLSYRREGLPGIQLNPTYETVRPDYPMGPGSPVAFSSPIDSPSSPVLIQRPHLGEQFSPIKTNSNMQSTLKKKRKVQEYLREDDKRLICNVPEHHNLEDYVAQLQNKIAWLKTKLKNMKQSKEMVTFNKGRKLIFRLQDELEERRSELEGLDLAIERQKKNLKKMKIEESQLKNERQIAKEELQFLKECNNQRIKRKYPFDQGLEMLDLDDRSDCSFDEHISFCQQLRLEGEIKCLEKTLVKRQTQLKRINLELTESKHDLKSAKLKVEDTVRKYDDAASSLENTAQETIELERRANKVGVQVLTEEERLKLIQEEYQEMKKKKNRLEKILKEINEVISQKDTEFQALDNKNQNLNLSYMQLQKDLVQMSHKERETTKSLLSSEELLLKKKIQINQLREQSENLSFQTEKADVQLKEKQVELMTVEQNLEQKKLELTNLLRDVQCEITLKQRELKLHQEEVLKMESQKLELVTVLHNKKGELLQVKEELKRNEAIVSSLNSDASKQREILKQITDQLKANQSELSVLKIQHEKKVENLENTNSHLQKIKSEMESISFEMRYRKEELELLNQSVTKERQDLNQLSMQRSSLESQVENLSDERNLLTDTNKKLNNQLNAMKKELNNVENKMKESQKNVGMMQDKLQNKQKDIELCQNTKSQLEKEFQDLKANLEDEQKEFTSLQTLIQNSELERTKLQKELKQLQSEKTETEMVLKELSNQIEKYQTERQEEFHQLNICQEKLKKISCILEEKTSEMESISQHNCNISQNLESLHEELENTKEKVQNLNQQVEPLQKSCEELEEIKKEKKEFEIELKLLQEQKSSMESHLEQLKKNITKLYQEPFLDKEIWMKIILNNKQEWRKEALKEKFLEEQDHLRLKLQQQMYRHVDVIEATRQQSEGFLYNLQHKLHVLQDVFLTNNINSPATNTNNKKNENLKPHPKHEKGTNPMSIEQISQFKEK